MTKLKIQTPEGKESEVVSYVKKLVAKLILWKQLKRKPEKMRSHMIPFLVKILKGYFMHLKHNNNAFRGQYFFYQLFNSENLWIFFTKKSKTTLPL